MIDAAEIEVGVKGKRITVRATSLPNDRGYTSDQEFTLTIDLARRLYNHLTLLIPIAVKVGEDGA